METDLIIKSKFDNAHRKYVQHGCLNPPYRYAILYVSV